MFNVLPILHPLEVKQILGVLEVSQVVESSSSFFMVQNDLQKNI